MCFHLLGRSDNLNSFFSTYYENCNNIESFFFKDAQNMSVNCFNEFYLLASDSD